MFNKKAKGSLLQGFLANEQSQDKVKSRIIDSFFEKKTYNATKKKHYYRILDNNYFF